MLRHVVVLNVPWCSWKRDNVTAGCVAVGMRLPIARSGVASCMPGSSLPRPIARVVEPKRDVWSGLRWCRLEIKISRTRVEDAHDCLEAFGSFRSRESRRDDETSRRRPSTHRKARHNHHTPHNGRPRTSPGPHSPCRRRHQGRRRCRPIRRWKDPVCSSSHTRAIQHQAQYQFQQALTNFNRYPKHVWSPAGGWYAQPSNWRANTAVMLGVVFGITAMAWSVSADREHRTKFPEPGRFFPSR